MTNAATQVCPGQAGAELQNDQKVTSEMIEAGLTELYAYNPDSSDGRVTVRRIMELALATRFLRDVPLSTALNELRALPIEWDDTSLDELGHIRGAQEEEHANGGVDQA